MTLQAIDMRLTSVRVILGGGGNAEQSRTLDRQLAAWMPPNAKLLYWPFALPDNHPLLDGCESWIASVFNPLNVRSIETWHADTLIADVSRAPLASFDGIYIGGGNTFRLLDLIRRSGLERDLIEFILSGGPVSGGSAGAVILGTDIGFAQNFGDRNDCNLQNTAGLNVIPSKDGNDILVLPHFIEPWRDDAQRLASSANAIVIGLADDAGLIVTGGEWRTAGRGSVTLIHPHGTRREKALRPLDDDLP